MKQNILAIIEKVDSLYENPKCELVFNSTFELLVAVILSAQCTDKRVNMVTEQLFKLAPTPDKMLQLGENKLKQIIYFKK